MMELQDGISSMFEGVHQWAIEMEKRTGKPGLVDPHASKPVRVRRV